MSSLKWNLGGAVLADFAYWGSSLMVWELSEGGSHETAFDVDSTLDRNEKCVLGCRAGSVYGSLTERKRGLVLSRLRKNTRPSCFRFGSAETDPRRPTPTRSRAIPRQPASTKIRIDSHLVLPKPQPWQWQSTCATNYASCQGTDSCSLNENTCH